MVVVLSSFYFMVAVLSLCVRVSCVDVVLRCVQCASCACRGRSHHYRARNGDAVTMCVSLFAAPPCISLLPLLFSTWCADLLAEFSNSTAAAARTCTRREMAMVVWCVWERGFRGALAPIRREQLDCVSYW
ncbi:hypothetical protein TcCL_NonESM09478 [Trypanosoma cruzi]|nr:hypothetical protein TcCL_NonESM09478 [Trypanosoma cruzi]